LHEIPKDLHHRLKLYCLEIDTSQMDFVSRALRERLDRLGTRTRGTRRREKRPQRTRRADTPRRMAPDSIREGMNELAHGTGRQVGVDHRKVPGGQRAEPVATVARRETPHPRGLYGGLV